jgi:glyoxylate carboligase
MRQPALASWCVNAFHKSAADLTGVVMTSQGLANATAANMTDLQFGVVNRFSNLDL